MSDPSAASRRQVLSKLGAGFAGAVILATGARPTRVLAADAAPDWPGALTRFIVPFPPGGPMDLLARTVGDALGAPGHSVVVDNLAGGAGNIGIQQAMRGPADGSVLLFIPQGNLTINPTLFPKLPFQWERDFRPVSLLASTPNVLVVGPAVAAKNVEELIAYGKANPGKLSYASPGIGSSLHLIGELFRRKAGIDMVHVPYKGTTPAMQDVAGGQVDLMFGALPTVRSFIDNGKLRPLAVTTAERAPTLADVPTLAQAGVTGIDVPSWYGVMAPAAVAPARIGQIHEKIAAVLARPDVKDRLVSQGLEIGNETTAAFAARIRSETAQWETVIREAGITPEQ